MKKMLLIALVMFAFSASACLAGEINLVGTWQGDMSLHNEHTGFVYKKDNSTKLIIEKEENGAFYGKREWTRNGTDYVEGFSGVMSPDGRRLYFAGHDDGYFFADVLGFDELTVYYLEDGGEAKAIRQNLKRVK
ncbi:hypothetical protein [Pseudodesulfovibrio sp. zrk46]|uniref:hypothetical protein n=1 Tax=Pseudodesulfovibrio sp. zrk46 TaxID=2725288 RepID=UPI001449880D|nr:hypothetical protein [Pseudodesulfovibrio sp. zrk46]QJB55755.1 hypothetical protein HFN16_04765 [Pseudodesulfovibrio sp. zrk46]